MPGDGAPAGGYPVHWEADVVLRDGATAHLRPITPADAEALRDFHDGQSARSTYFRFFGPKTHLDDADLHGFTHVDHRDRVALVAVTPTGGRDRIIGVGRYDRTGPQEAEVAFNVADTHHGRGLGSVLLEHLAAAARERGIHLFTAEVLAGNAKMLTVFRDAGYDVDQRLADGVVSVSFAIDPTDRSMAVMADREHRAEARSVAAIFEAASVLLLRPDPAADPGGCALAGRVLRSLLDGGYRGGVHVVGPALADDGEAPGPADGAPARHWPGLTAVPAEARPEVAVLTQTVVPTTTVEDLAGLGVRAVVLLGGADTADLAAQRSLLRAARAAGMRVVGPASYGLLSTGGRLNLSMEQRLPAAGSVGLFCQSAPMAVGLLRAVERRRIGLSSFLSAGHRADVSGNDLMQFWEEDPATSVVGVYLESIGNPRKFSRIARRLSATTPVIAMMSGASGFAVPPGHAVQASTQPREAVLQMFRQSGVIRVGSTHELLDVAQILAHQPVPGGDGVAVIASGHAVATLVGEEVEAAGLRLAREPLVVHAGTPRLAAHLAAVFADPAVHVVIAVDVPVPPAQDETVAVAVAGAAAGSGRTTLVCALGLHGVPEILTAADAEGWPRAVPAYATAEDAVRAAAAAVGYGRWRRRDHGPPVDPQGVDRRAARTLVETLLADRRETTLDPRTAAELLACYGVTVWPSARVTTAEQAVAAADRLGWPVVLKTADPQLRHRTDLGGVRVDIADAAELRADVAAMTARLSPAVGFEVQRDAGAGVACLVRCAEDPLLGPVVSFGLAGDATELLGDLAYAIAPLTTGDVRDLVAAPRAAPRLSGFRGLPPVDVGALHDVVARVSALVDDLPQVRNLELHPVLVSPTGAAVLHARVELAVAGRTDGVRRALRS